MVLSTIIFAVRSLLLLLLGGQDNTDSVNILIYNSPTSTGTIIPRGDFSTIDPNNKIIIIIHGYNGGFKDFERICQLHKEEDPSMTVLNVDWDQLAKGNNYFRAVKNTELVGRYIGHWIVDANIDPSKAYITGHSLGAHAAGFAAKIVFALTGNKLKEIRGLEPAAPLYDFVVPLPAYSRMDPSDANSVLCVHTNMGIGGTVFDLGSTNLYVNNAWLQPGCGNLSDLCSHFYAVTLYSKAIRDHTYVAYRISSFLLFTPVGINMGDSFIFGLDLPLDKRGMYYLEAGALPT